MREFLTFFLKKKADINRKIEDLKNDTKDTYSKRVEHSPFFMPLIPDVAEGEQAAQSS